jgi:hypothetical protein
MNIELNRQEARDIAEALRIYRDRFYRHQSEVSEETWMKNRVKFVAVDLLRDKIQKGDN